MSSYNNKNINTNTDDDINNDMYKQYFLRNLRDYQKDLPHLSMHELSSIIRNEWINQSNQQNLKSPKINKEVYVIDSSSDDEPETLQKVSKPIKNKEKEVIVLEDQDVIKESSPMQIEKVNIPQKIPPKFSTSAKQDKEDWTITNHPCWIRITSKSSKYDGFVGFIRNVSIASHIFNMSIYGRVDDLNVRSISNIFDYKTQGVFEFLTAIEINELLYELTSFKFPERSIDKHVNKNEVRYEISHLNFPIESKNETNSSGITHLKLFPRDTTFDDEVKKDHSNAKNNIVSDTSPIHKLHKEDHYITSKDQISTEKLETSSKSSHKKIPIQNELKSIKTPIQDLKLSNTPLLGYFDNTGRLPCDICLKVLGFPGWKYHISHVCLLEAPYVHVIESKSKFSISNFKVTSSRLPKIDHILIDTNFGFENHVVNEKKRKVSDLQDTYEELESEDEVIYYL